MSGGAGGRPNVSRLLVMGVAGAGKTTLGRAVANELGWAFLDADSFHGDMAKAKMAAGVGLDEDDRAGWLARVRAAFHAEPSPVVLACSALRANHRHALAPDLIVYLAISEARAEHRLAERTGHYAGPALVPSQFAALEPPTDALELSADSCTADQVGLVLRTLSPT